MELTPRKLPHGTYTIEVASWNLHDGCFPPGTYTMEVTSWN